MSTEKYLGMQESYYENLAGTWSLDNKDPVVSWYDYHERHTDYDTKLFRMPEDTSKWVVLDYGCGPGRSMIRYANRFMRIDGVDIADKNLENALLNLEAAGLKAGNVYKNNGKDLSMIKDGTYDCAFSVICLQHICVHEIRYSIMSEIYRTLKVGGYFCAQMAFGSNRFTPYYDNYYDAGSTNGGNDVSFDNEEFLKDDLKKIGFGNYSSVIADPCQDQHPHWLWFQAQKI